jgi:hypothetical protein
VQRIATEGPWPAFYQAKTSFIAQQAAGWEGVGRVEAWGVQWRSARERGKACRSEPAAHVDDEG